MADRDDSFVRMPHPDRGVDEDADTAPRLPALPAPSHTMRERLAIVERRQQDTEQRLRDGTHTFDDLRGLIAQTRREVHEMRGENHDMKTSVDKLLRPPVWKIITGLGSAAVILVTAIWYLSTYPKRDEYEADKAAVDVKIQKVEGGLSEVRSRQIEIRGDVKAIKESQARTEHAIEKLNDKIDQIANEGRR